MFSTHPPRNGQQIRFQARFMLCSLNQWSKYDGTFNMQKFFNNIVLLFEANPKDPWCIETLSWWNK